MFKLVNQQTPNKTRGEENLTQTHEEERNRIPGSSAHLPVAIIHPHHPTCPIKQQSGELEFLKKFQDLERWLSIPEGTCCLCKGPEFSS